MTEANTLGTTTSPMNIGWLYLLKKPELIQTMSDRGLETSGTVKELRKRLSHYLKETMSHRSTQNLCEEWEWESKIVNLRTQKIPTEVRKGGLRIDSSGKPLEFLERIEELSCCYDLPTDHLVRTLPEIFRGNALEWLRINKDSFKSWNDFKKAFLRHFLPTRYVHKLEEEILRKRQGPREKAKDYIQAVQYLIRQHPRMTTIDNIDRIYDSLRPEYRLHIKRRDFQTLEELMELAEEYEFVKNEEKAMRPPPLPTPNRNNIVPPQHRPSNPFSAPRPIYQGTPAYDRRTHCWNCKKPGHHKTECRSPSLLFCSHCGKEGQLTRDCTCQRIEPTKLNATQSDPRYFIPLTIEDQKYNALIDTGATKSFIGPEIRKQLQKLQYVIRSHPHVIQLADGKNIVANEHYTVTFQLGNKIVTGEATFLHRIGRRCNPGDGPARKIKAGHIDRGTPAKRNESRDTVGKGYRLLNTIPKFNGIRTGSINRVFTKRTGKIRRDQRTGKHSRTPDTP